MSTLACADAMHKKRFFINSELTTLFNQLYVGKQLVHSRFQKTLTMESHLLAA